MPVKRTWPLDRTCFPLKATFEISTTLVSIIIIIITLKSKCTQTQRGRVYDRRDGRRRRRLNRDLVMSLFIHYIASPPPTTTTARAHTHTTHTSNFLQTLLPAAAMFYTDLRKLRGLDVPVDYGSGVEYADGILLQSGIPALQMGLWLGGVRGCRDLLRGKLEEELHRLMDYLVSCRAKRVYLRVGYEFDNPDFGYYNGNTTTTSRSGQDDYRAAFRRIVHACRTRGPPCWDKVDFVWHSWGAGLVANCSLWDFYPGDEYVDWVGVSLFTQFYPTSPTGNVETVRQVLDFAKTQDKPVMIAESTPFGGIDQLDDPWEQWFQPVLDLIEEHDIAMWSYINCDWTSQPMWANTGFGDTRLSINETVMKLWRRHVMENPRFVMTVDALSGCREARRSYPILSLARSKDSTAAVDDKRNMRFDDLAERPLVPPEYWLVPIAIALAALCLHTFFRPCPERSVGSSMTVSCDEDEDDPELVHVESDCTGYGTIVEESSEENPTHEPLRSTARSPKTTALQI